MSDKKLILVFSLLLIAIAIALTAFLPENEFMHAPFQMIVISVILLSIHMQMKDIIIIVMLVSAVIWGLAFYEVIGQTHQLIAENAIIFAVSLVLGLYETGYREEKHKLVVVANYKKKETETLRNEITALNAENHSIMEKIKEYKKYF
jgi:hypothetical protein